MHAFAFAAYVFTFVLSFDLLLRLELDASEVWRSLLTSVVIRTISAAMNDQPRHQHRSPSAASHRTIARRPPKPLVAQRAQRQRRLKATSHDYIHRNTFAPMTLPSSAAYTHPTFHQQHLNRTNRPPRHLAFRETTRGATSSAGEHGAETWQECLGQIIRHSNTEFKGCQRHSSKGDS